MSPSLVGINMFGTPRPELNAHAAASTAWVVSLARLTGQDRSRAGGKAVNLGEMLRAGLPVPGGFCVSTAAFRLWLEGDRAATASQEPPIQAGRDAFHCVPEFSGKDGDAVERVPTGFMYGEQVRRDECASQEADRGRSTAAAALRQALARVPVPAPVAQAIRAALAPRGPEAAWAVRSSATAEDLAEASFAGQHDSLLDVRGPEAVLEAVRCCWISLFTERATAYRLKHRVPDRAVAMAVVVQEFVPAEISGVLFTADPLTGDTRRLIIEAAPGLGDTLVSGKVSPDRLVLDKETLRLLDQTVHRIQHPGGRDSVEPLHPGHAPSQGSTESRSTRDEPCLDKATARCLGRLGIEAERLFGAPQDLEWAARGGQVFLLQSRPITALSPRPKAEPEIWTNANIMEALPDVVTPMAWSLMRILQDDFLHPLMRRLRLDLDHWPLIDVIAGRAYLNVRLVAELVQKAAGPIRADFTVAFGGLHEGLASVLPPESLRSGTSLHGWTWRELLRLGVWMLPGLIGQQRVIERWGERVFGDLAHAAPAHLSDEQLADQPSALLRLATLGEGDRTWAAALWMAAAAVGGSTATFQLTRRWLGDTDGSLANRLLAGATDMRSAENGLELLRLAAWARRQPELNRALLDPVPFAAIEQKLAAVAQGPEFLDRWRTFMERHGHQARGGMDISQPRWSEQPDFVLDMLRVYLCFDEASDPLTGQARERREREILWADCRRRLRHPFKRWLFTFLVRMGRRGLAQRENVKNEGVRLVAILRRTVLEAGRRLAERGVLRERAEVFFLRFEELGPVLRGRPDFEVATVIAARQAEFARHRLLSPPPLIVGRYDPDAPAPAPAGPLTRTLQGLAVSPGIVTGKARVILQTDAAERMQAGEILVAPYTDPGWTPYFLAAAALVVDVGGLLSHGSVVAREYGLPAVVNVGPATKLIRTGQTIRVDGHRGTVTLLD